MGSKVADLAREEAARAESDEQTDDGDDVQNGDGDVQTDGEQTPAEPQPEAMTPEKVEALFASLRREDDRHAREVEKRAGPMFADLAPCPTCGPTAGFVFAALPPHEVDAVLERVRAAFGMDTDSVLKYADDKEMCPSCDGWGRTLTHSKVDTQRALPCGACNGAGWRNKMPAPVVPPAVGAFTPVPNLVTPQTNGADGVRDPWGRPLGHPHYGLAPESVGA